MSQGETDSNVSVSDFSSDEEENEIDSTTERIFNKFKVSINSKVQEELKREVAVCFLKHIRIEREKLFRMMDEKTKRELEILIEEYEREVTNAIFPQKQSSYCSMM